jgi:hypothetical protein
MNGLCSNLSSPPERQMRSAREKTAQEPSRFTAPKPEGYGG